HPSGAALLFARRYGNMNSDLFLLDLRSGQFDLLTPHDGEASFAQAQFDALGKGVYLLTDLNSEFHRVAHIDLRTKQITFLTDDQWDAETLAISPAGDQMAFAHNVDGTSRLTVATIRTEASPELVSLHRIDGLPEGVIADIAWSPNGRELSLTLSAPGHAMEVWTVDVAQMAAYRRTFASISAVPADTFVTPELVHYPSFDGLSIPAFYYRPKQGTGPYPVVVYVHGGPESQSRNGFNSVVQYFVNRGYAVFVPNVRGSSGYGRTYVHLDDVRKRMDSVADLACCVDWLVEHGQAKRDAIAVMGGSYGGFMVLAAVTHYPELWAAGVDIVGIANLRTFIEHTSPYRRHLREPEYGTIEQDGAFFDEISPIHHVERITAPLMVIHGANDPRVPIGEAEQIVEALRRRNHPVEYLRFEDEGHGVVKLPNRIVAYGQIADFLDRHLTGRS
ncbi:MAG: S9 family peptidase, partial [Alicyclobacillus sp.]|nr:S9 family peptidase [Alicyclobacillus sp.]